MPDPGNPDQDPKPFKPDPSKGPFGWYKPPTEPQKPLSEPDPDYDPDRLDQTHATDQETLFRAAAIKCAQIEDELGKLVIDATFKYLDRPPRMVQLFKFPSGNFDLYSTCEDIIGVVGGQLQGKVAVRYANIVEDYGKKSGTNPRYTLEIGLHTDKDTQKVYAEFAQKDPIIASNAKSYYYFDAEGNYRKISDIPNEIPVPNRSVIIGNRHMGKYESEMTAGDFELAAQALAMLIKRVKDPNWDQKPQQEKPAE